MTQPTCETCRFWSRVFEPGYPFTSDHDYSCFGHCRIRSPAINYGLFRHRKVNEFDELIPLAVIGEATNWPVTVDDDWCGEHQERKPEGEE